MQNDQDLNFLKLKLQEQAKTSDYINYILKNHTNLDSKTRCLIEIALAVQEGSELQIENCIKEAIKNGVTKGDIMSAACYGLKRHNGTMLLHLKTILDASNVNDSNRTYRSTCFWSNDY